MKYLNALNKIDGVGSQKIRLLLNYFTEPENIWKAGPEDLIKSGIGEVLAAKILEERESIDPDRGMAENGKGKCKNDYARRRRIPEAA